MYSAIKSRISVSSCLVFMIRGAKYVFGDSHADAAKKCAAPTGCLPGVGIGGGQGSPGAERGRMARRREGFLISKVFPAPGNVRWLSVGSVR